MRSSALRHAATRANHVHAFRDRLIWLRCAVCPPPQFEGNLNTCAVPTSPGPGPAGAFLSPSFSTQGPGRVAAVNATRPNPGPVKKPCQLLRCAPVPPGENAPVSRPPRWHPEGIRFLSYVRGRGMTTRWHARLASATRPRGRPGPTQTQASQSQTTHSLSLKRSPAPRRTLPFLAASSPLLLRSAYKYLPSTRHRFS